MAQVGEHLGAQAAQGARHQARRRQQAAAALDAFGRHRSRRVGALPAGTLLPILGPGVCRTLAHDVEVVHRRWVRSLVTGDDARGNTQLAHQHYEGGSEVFTKAGAPVHPEFVDRVGAEVLAGRQCVAEVCRANVLHEGARECVRVGAGVLRLAAQLSRPRQRARVEPLGQLQIVAQANIETQWAVGVLGVGARAETQPLQDRPVGESLQIVLHDHLHAFDERRMRRSLEQRQHRQAQGLQRHLITQLLAQRAQVAGKTARRGEGGWQRAPLGSVKPPKHRAAEIHGLRAWHGALEAHPQRDAVVQRHFGHRPHAHAQRKAGAGGSVLGYAPQGPDAREQHEQQRHDGRAEQGGARRERAGLAQAGLSGRHVGEHERRQQAPHRHQHGAGNEQRLRIQEVREHQEETEEEHDEGVASGAQLEGLERHQRHRHRDAGLLAEERLIRPQRQARGHAQHQQDDAAAGQGALAHCEQGAPDQHRASKYAAPDGKVGHVRRNGPADHADQEQCVARFTRQVAPARPAWPAGPAIRHPGESRDPSARGGGLVGSGPRRVPQ